MKKTVFILFLTLLPTLVIAQASGGQITRPSNKQQNVQNRGGKSSNDSNKPKVIREVYYESILSVDERKVWEEEKAKAKETMRLLATNIKRQDLEPGSSGFSEGLAWCKRKNGEICFIDKKGNIVLSLPSIIKKTRSFKNGFAVVEKSGFDTNGHWVGKNKGVIDKKGNFIISFGKYWFISNNSECMFYTVEEKKCGYINEEGKIAIPFIYDAETGYSEDFVKSSFKEGLACVKKGGKYGYIDKNGKEVLPFIYDFADEFSEGLAGVSIEKKDGYIDKNGDVVIPFSTGIWGTYPFTCGLSLLIKSDNRKYFINPNGTTVIKTKLAGDESNISDKFSEDLVAICPNGAKSGKWGYMDKQGKITIPSIYSFAGDFSEGLAFVCRNGYSGFINTKGQIVVPFKFHNDFLVGMKFEEGIAPIYHEGRWGYVDKYGNSTFDFE